MPAQRDATIHGVSVKQTQLQGKWYTPVDARVKIAEQADPALIRREEAGYHVVSVQFIQIADKWAYHCMVEYPAGSGVIKPGTDFIDTKDPSGVAKAETSAIGRALGLHGIAVEESIASAEEMSRVAPAFAPEMDEGERVVDSPVDRQTRRQAPKPAPQRSTATQPPTRPAQQPQQTQDMPVSEWVTTDGYEPLNDDALKARLRVIGVTTLGDAKALLRDAKAQYRVFDRAAVMATVKIYEARHAAAQRKLPQGAATQHTSHNLEEAFPADQQRGA